MEEGTIVHVEYDLYNAESGDLIETTREDVAKEHEMHQEGRKYTPMVCVVGSGNLISGFEDSLLEAKADKDISLEIAPADAYGEKDPAQVETISIDKLIRHVRDPKALYIGGPVTIDGRTGTLSYLAAGRARIDYNHPMAGRKLKYDYKIVKVIEDKDEKVSALLESNTGHEGFEVSFDGNDISIVVPEAMLFDTNAAMQKFRLVSVLRDAVDAEKVSFVEMHKPRVADEEEEEHVHDENCDHDHEEE
ncbi:MAG: FKBP-type peptidyl-prolyl cis-trans isomerase [Candidatus Poseidoniaceae archaeon]|jgi:FKBP-type peptidyl-prolyl cis-trans isomerase 2|nr:FKBP-type peptidyl-prolyl cis-trans isomerase [Candidatus Poseidoniaceae archaeon]